MGQHIKILIKYCSNYPWTYRLVSFSLSILFALCLFLYFIFLTPNDLIRAGKDFRPPELQMYSQFRDIAVSLLLFLFLFISLKITLLGPFYLKNKKILDKVILQYKLWAGSIIRNYSFLKYSFIAIIIIWTLTSSAFTIWLLFKTYPPTLGQLIFEIYGMSTAEHFTTHINLLFYSILFIGFVSIFSPLFLITYYRFKTKGEC